MSYKNFNEYEIIDGLIYLCLYKRNGDSCKTIFYEKHLDKIKNLNLTWHMWWNKDTETYYCRATKYLGIFNEKPKYKTIYLHKVILNFPKGIIDHFNHDTLDNRDDNLRITTKASNCQHRGRINSNNKIGHRNICRVGNKLLVQLQINGKNSLLGKFNLDELDKAISFAEEMRKKYYGEYSGTG